MSISLFAWYDGHPIPIDELPIQPAWEPWGFEGKGAFTTSRTFHKQQCIAFWPRHLARLHASLTELAISIAQGRLPSEREALYTVAGEDDSACVRLNVVNGIHAWVVAQRLPVTPNPTRLAISSEPVSEDRGHKFVAQEWRRTAERESNAKGVWDVLAFDSKAMVTDGSRANVLIRFGSTWVTPPANGRLLPGVVRGALLDHGLVEERPVKVKELLAAADEIVCTNSVRGIVPIHEVEGRSFTPGQATKHLQEWFEKAAVAHAG